MTDKKPEIKETLPESAPAAREERGFWSSPAAPAETPARPATPAGAESMEAPKTVALFVGPQGSRYQLFEPLGHGGMADVHRAHRVGAAGFVRDVAIKRIRAKYDKIGRMRRMFADEARVASRLNHRGIVQVHDYFEQDDTYYLVMELVQGRNLRDVLDKVEQKGAILSEAFACHVCAEVAEALHHAHGAHGEDGEPLGIVHRDLSPHNVMISDAGEVKILDFGIAFSRLEGRLQTESGITKGKFAYMSPEQVRRQPLDGRSDLFSLGILFVELLSGKRVFDGADESETLRRIEACDPRLLEAAVQRVPPPLAKVVRGALAADREQRYRNGAELARELRGHLFARGHVYGADEVVAELRALQDLPDAPATVPALPPPPLEKPKRRSLQWPIAVAVLIALSGAAATLLLRSPVKPAVEPAPTPPKHAPDETAQARELLRKANAHFQLGEFEEAGELFREAYRLKPAPALLYNIAQTLRFQRRYQQAAALLERYAASAPDGAHKAQALAQAENMRRKLQPPPKPAKRKDEPAPPAGPAPIRRRSLDGSSLNTFSEQTERQSVSRGSNIEAELLDAADANRSAIRLEVSKLILNGTTVAVPAGSLITCAPLGVFEGRIGITCESIQLGDRQASFRGLVLDAGEKPGVPAGAEKGTQVVVRVQEGF